MKATNSIITMTSGRLPVLVPSPKPKSLRAITKSRPAKVELFDAPGSDENRAGDACAVGQSEAGYSYLVDQLKFLRNADVDAFDRLVSDISTGKYPELSETPEKTASPRLIPMPRAAGRCYAESAMSTLNLKKPVGNLDEALHSSLEMLQALGGARLAVEMELDNCPAGELLLSAADLSIILINLVRNAAMAKAERIDIIALPSERDPERSVTLIIEDNGMGIPPSILDHIFDSNQMTYGTNLTGRFNIPLRNRGLALQLVRELVEGAGGTIAASRSYERGSRFEICLPISPCA